MNNVTILNTDNPEFKLAMFEYLLRTGDDLLILGHRLSEWCGHAPILEEDIALGNISLDCIGQASAFLKLASEIEGKGRTEDDLAFFREAVEFKNLKITELPKGDFAFTMMRQFLFDTYSYYLFRDLQKSSFVPLAGIASKAFKESSYHLRHSSQWILRLGDGTEESHKRAQKALNDLWMYTGEFFITDYTEELLHTMNASPLSSSLYPDWKSSVSEIINQATLDMPDDNQYMVNGSRQGLHTEHLGHLLSEMQIVARSFPGAKW